MRSCAHDASLESNGAQDSRIEPAWRERQPAACAIGVRQEARQPEVVRGGEHTSFMRTGGLNGAVHADCAARRGAPGYCGPYAPAWRVWRSSWRSMQSPSCAAALRGAAFFAAALRAAGRRPGGAVRRSALRRACSARTRSSRPGTPSLVSARCTRSSNTFSRRSQVSVARSRAWPTRFSTTSRTWSARPPANLRAVCSKLRPSLTSASNSLPPSAWARPNAPTPASQTCCADSLSVFDSCSACAWAAAAGGGLLARFLELGHAALPAGVCCVVRQDGGAV